MVRVDRDADLHLLMMVGSNTVVGVDTLAVVIGPLTLPNLLIRALSLGGLRMWGLVLLRGLYFRRRVRRCMRLRCRNDMCLLTMMGRDGNLMLLIYDVRWLVIILVVPVSGRLRTMVLLDRRLTLRNRLGFIKVSYRRTLNLVMLLTLVR